MTIPKKQLPETTTKTCFIVTAIGNPGSPERVHADKTLKHIIDPVCSELGYKITRVDQESINGNITESIINHLKTDNLVIADLTGHNPNAFYELGYRQALNLPLIPIIAKGQQLPFDVVTNRTLFFDMDVDEIDSYRSALKELILDFDEFVMPTQRNQSKLNLQSIDNKIDEVLNILKKDNYKTKSQTPTKVKTPKNSKRFNENLIANLKINHEDIKLKGVGSLQQSLQRIIDQNPSKTINASFLQREPIPRLSLSDKKF
ncbi:hypothetical protein [Streptococcus pyogenes]|uniref:hypothetical protein n=1 Tax=Streptococcus pyogenes TaxID=1314 RepID=UPI000A1D92F9|nr:hypothetical protein [Streptococcus pyogenes]NSX76403.1 hypothetical protein [Streptococcus pyogenes]NTS71039.1 hypothetical protein [Streptococcus pyogenes]OUI73336.1 hypothetical protein B7R59_01255 [Streptococcus pyogenes]PWO37904.1 hypothetical protein DJ557_00770 [Streptococcus pyogenes]QCK49215.1 hypothetical protein ETT59_05205 [Streptococcus pyogenes]